MAAVRVLCEMNISPWLPSQPPQPLSFLDAMWLLNPQMVERLFFFNFPHPTSHFMKHNLSIFTNSLSLTLRHFYPLAGTIRRSPHSDDQFDIAYKGGDTVTITVAEFTGDDFGNISGHQPRSFRSLRLLVPKPEKSPSIGQFPPISIQITIFPNQGICIGFAINHAVCDGSGSMRFIQSWAVACRSAKTTLGDIYPPFLNRSIIVDNFDMRRKIFEMARQLKQDALPVSEAGLVSATFTLGKDQIARLKERVRAKGEEEGKPSFHISAFVVTCAFVWGCLVRSRGYHSDDNECFGCVADWRMRMNPPIPSNYFGNCLGGILTKLKAGELMGKNGIEVAAMEIGKCIDGLQGRDVGEVLEAVINKYGEVEGSRMLTVAGSPRLRVYEVDFGWGRPVKVELTSIAESGAMSLAESREEEGGMEIGLVLSEEEMNKFGTCFAAGLLDM